MQRKKARRKSRTEMEAIECPICMESSKRWVGLECAHRVCFDCAKQWQQNKKYSCPLCRHESDVLRWLKTRCPPRNAQGVSRVSKRLWKRSWWFHCHGCGNHINSVHGTFHTTCRTLTCTRCFKIARDTGGVPCATCLSKGVFGCAIGQRLPDVIPGGIFGIGLPPPPAITPETSATPDFPPPAYVDLSLEALENESVPPLFAEEHGLLAFESTTRSTAASYIPTS